MGTRPRESLASPPAPVPLTDLHRTSGSQAQPHARRGPPHISTIPAGRPDRLNMNGSQPSFGARVVTDTILMVRPVRFGYNPETAENNIYQSLPPGLSPEGIHLRALEEFDGFVGRLREAGITVVVIDETAPSTSTDSIFPNNWFSTHRDGTVVTYPMWAPSRRAERREELIHELRANGRSVTRRIDYAPLEREGRFLEGTGSMVLDRRNRKAYACRSPRTDELAFQAFCRDLRYEPVLFSASQLGPGGQAVDVYHSNVMMSIGQNVAVLAADTIRDPAERSQVIQGLAASGRYLLTISEEQCRSFAGNMLQVSTTDGNLVLVMSEQAYRSLSPRQIEALESRTGILHTPLYTIEACGGGSARCMMAEVFLPSTASLDCPLTTPA